jgi:hypothetical protein
MYFTGESILDVFWQTMRAGHFPYGQARERQEFWEFFNIMRSAFALYRSLAAYPERRATALLQWNAGMAARGIVSSTSFVARTSFVTGNRAMCTTASMGLIGMVPSGSIETDTIMILEGGKVPFVVRPIGYTGEWELIGACYLHGAMHGQMYKAEKSESIILV